MKSRFNTIRYKLILAFFASSMLAGITMLFSFTFIMLLLYKQYNDIVLFMSKHMIATSIVMLIIYVIVMNSFYLLLTRNGVNYLNEITSSLNQIAQGNLDTKIPVKNTDELGKLAVSVNTMSQQLKELLEEERSWERAKNDLVTNISHDLRTPLTSILGYVELIANTKYSDENTLQHYSNIALTKCMELKVLIDDLFEYSKLNSVEMKVNKVKINIGELLEQVLLSFVPSLEETNMEYRLRIEDRKIFVVADPMLMVRLFSNLIGNALHYGKEGKYVDIELVRVEEKAVIRIVNYGDAILEADLPQIFEKFYRGDESRTQNQGSSGIGLAIVKCIVDKHNGSIHVISTKNQTVFEVGLFLAG